MLDSGPSISTVNTDHSADSPHQRQQPLSRENCGSVSVEYVVVLTVVGIAGAIALLEAGAPLVLLYDAVATWISIGII